MSAYRHGLAWLVLSAVALVGCPDDEDNASATDTGPEVSADTGTDVAVDAETDTTDDVPADVTADPSSDAVDDVTTEPQRPLHTIFLVSEMYFTVEEPAGIAPGFDLDGRVSSSADPMGCGIGDFTGPNGEEGVDNQFAKMMPIIEAVGISQLPEYLLAGIREGGILIVAVIDDLDDLQNDDQVTLTLVEGRGRPLLDNFEYVESWQTLELEDEDTVLGFSTEARVVDGMLEAELDAMRLPAVIFDVTVDLRMGLARFAFPVGVGDDRPGYASGALELDQLIAIAERTPSEGLDDTLRSLGPQLSDLDVDGDGECSQMSAVLEIGMSPVFLMPGALESVGLDER